MDRKHCGKRRNCSLRAIFPFPTVFSKDLLQTRKNQGLFGKGLNGQLSIDMQKISLWFPFTNIGSFKTDSPPGWLSGERVGLLT